MVRWGKMNPDTKEKDFPTVGDRTERRSWCFMFPKCGWATTVFADWPFCPLCGSHMRHSWTPQVEELKGRRGSEDSKED